MSVSSPPIMATAYTNLLLACQVHLRHYLRIPRLLCLGFLRACPGQLLPLTVRVSRRCTWCIPLASQLQRTWSNICGLDFIIYDLQSVIAITIVFTLAHHCMTHVFKMTGPVFNSRPFQPRQQNPKRNPSAWLIQSSVAYIKSWLGHGQAVVFLLYCMCCSIWFLLCSAVILWWPCTWRNLSLVKLSQD